VANKYSTYWIIMLASPTVLIYFICEHHVDTNSSVTLHGFYLV